MPGDIAVIFHQDLDEVAAVHLADRKVKAVINGAQSISGKYPNYGPKILSDAGIPIIDDIGQKAFECIKENDYLEVSENTLWVNNKFICHINFLDGDMIERKMAEARENIWEVLRDFIDNTLDYAAKERDIVVAPVVLPPIKTRMEKKHVLIVIRKELPGRSKGYTIIYRRGSSRYNRSRWRWGRSARVWLQAASGCGRYGQCK